MRVFDCSTLKNYHWDSEIQSTEASNKIEKSVTTSTRVQQLCMEKNTPTNRDEEEIIRRLRWRFNHGSSKFRRLYGIGSI